MTYDIEVNLDRITNEFQQALSKLAPFGVGNPEPVIRIENVPIESPKLIGKKQDSTSFNIGPINCVCFNDTQLFKSEANKISVLANIRKTCYNKSIIQFLLKDYKLNIANEPKVINYKLRNSKAQDIRELLKDNGKLEKLDRKLLVDIYKIAKLSNSRGVYINQLLDRYKLSLFDLIYILNIFKELKLLNFQIDNNLVTFEINDTKANLEDSKLLKLYQKETNGFI